MKYLIILLLCSCASLAQAAVYQCESNGTVTFSQFPCDKVTESAQQLSDSNVVVQSNKPTDHQLDQLHKRSRYIEYQQVQADDQYQHQVELLKTEIYNASKLLGSRNKVLVLNQKMHTLEQDHLKQQQQLTAQFNQLQQQIHSLERQYAQH